LAAETEVRVEVEMMVPPLQRLEVDPPVLVMPEIQAEDVASGFAEMPRAIVLTVSSNTAWELAIRWSGDGRSANGVTPKGSPTLDWAAGNGPFQALSPDWAMVATGVATESEQIELRLRVPMRPGEVIPGTYEPRLEYRLAAAGE
jgi:hypothetical protein